MKQHKVEKTKKGFKIGKSNELVEKEKKQSLAKNSNATQHDKLDYIIHLLESR